MDLSVVDVASNALTSPSGVSTVDACSELNRTLSLLRESVGLNDLKLRPVLISNVWTCLSIVETTRILWSNFGNVNDTGLDFKVITRTGRYANESSPATAFLISIVRSEEIDNRLVEFSVNFTSVTEAA